VSAQDRGRDVFQERDDLNKILIAHERQAKRQANRGRERAPQRAVWKAHRQTPTASR
jgi:hypothetical protein